MNPLALLWGVTMGGLLAVFALDFVRVSQNPRDPSPRACAIWSALYLLSGLLFGLLVVLGGNPLQGAGFFEEWIGAYTTSLDTVFVLILITSALGLPRGHQKWILLLGIASGLAVRSALVVAGGTGSVPLGWLFFAFGAVLLVGGGKLFERGDRDAWPEPGEPSSAGKSVVPAAFAVLATTVVFALNLVPTVSGVTGQASLTLAANAFAVLPLCRLFYLISGVLDRMVHGAIGLAAVLAFVGAQFVLDSLLPHDLAREPGVVALSLGMTAAVLVATRISSRLSSPIPGLRTGADAVRVQHPNP